MRKLITLAVVVSFSVSQLSVATSHAAPSRERATDGGRQRQHLVSELDMTDRLAAIDTQRADDIRALDQLLASRPAVLAGARFEIDSRALSESLPLLTDSELRDVARRAESLPVDPAAGSTQLDGVGTLGCLLLGGFVLVVAAVAGLVVLLVRISRN